MKKSSVLLICGLTLFLTACQSNKETTTGTNNDTVVEKSQKYNEQGLVKGMWDSKIYNRLTELINDEGKSSSSYDSSKKPYAVFDWDNTSIIQDIGEATFTYQISNLVFKMTPEQFDSAIRSTLPADDFKDEFRNKAGESVNIDRIAKDLLSDYKVLYDQYEGMKGDKALSEVKELDEYKDFSAKLRYLYEAVGGSFSSDISYPWVTYLFTGMTSEDVQELSRKSIDYALNDELKKETWESPATLLGEAGQVSVTFKRGVRSVKEMQNLYKTLMDNGIDVYICSASHVDVVIPFASDEKYGYNIPVDHIFGMQLKKDTSGLIQAEYNTNYAQTQGEGKTETIKKLIATSHGEKDPILIAGDSNGDYAMLKDFSDLKMGIIFNLLRDPEKGVGLLAKEAVRTYENKDAVYFLQGRDENKGELRQGRETIKLDSDEAKLMKE